MNNLGIENSFWGSIKLTSKESLFVGSFIDPLVQALATTKNLIKLYKESINSVILLNCCQWVILTTYPEINWSSSTVSSNASSPAMVFLDWCEDVFLVQHVQNPTRSRGDHWPSLLDLVFTYSPEAIDNITRQDLIA